MTGQPASFLLEGTSSITEGSKVTKLDLAKLHARYADAGAMTVTKAQRRALRPQRNPPRGRAKQRRC